MWLSVECGFEFEVPESVPVGSYTPPTPSQPVNKAGEVRSQEAEVTSEVLSIKFYLYLLPFRVL